MPIKTPKFWYRDESSKPPFIEVMLAPLSMVYKFGQHLNLSNATTKTAPIPVICIGNITAGGSGKTPAIIALHKLITKHQIFNAPYFLSRGYGGVDKGARCISVHDGANEVGDEPLLLLSHSKTIISVNRYDGAMLAHELGADCVLMDDGFQNQTLYKDLSLIVINGKSGLGNKKLLPAGPLREPIDNAFMRAQGVIMIGDDEMNIAALIPDNLPVFKAYIKATNIDNLDRDAKYIGFAGLANPQKFHDTLLENNINIVDFHEFADHHPYSDKEIEILIDKSKGAKLITTEKDYVRVSDKYREYIDYLSIELIWEDEKAMVDLIKARHCEPKVKQSTSEKDCRVSSASSQ